MSRFRLPVALKQVTMETAMAPLPTAVIGYGFSGRAFHAYLVSLAPQLRLHGIAARRPAAQEAILARGDCRLYRSFEEAIGDAAVELVVIATPNSEHAPMAIAALEAGKHVVVDKPAALSGKAGDAMLAAAQKSGKMLSVFHNRRFDGDYLTLRALMESGQLGEVKWIEMAWQGFGPCGGWRGEQGQGGRFFDLGAHLIDQMLQFFPDRITGVYCRMHHDFAGRDTESEALVVLSFAGGATGICDMSSLSAISKPRFLVHGSRATFVKTGVDPQEKAMIAGDIDAARENPANFGRLHNGQEESLIPTLPGRWRNFYENIGEVLQGRAEPEVKFEEVRRVLQVFDAAQEAARTGTVVETDIAPLASSA